ETAFLSFIAERARAAGATRLTGWYLPTKKNAPCKEFYASHKFEIVEKNDAGGLLYACDLAANEIAWPKWIKRLDAGARA
ncbi:MAG: hypothetical protein EDX89_06270, partial [Acidobacteria bacterium]